MKQLKAVEEVAGEGLESLLGEVVILMCVNYFYTGTLVGVNATFVKLENPEIIYATGDWSKKGWADSQKLPNKEHYVQITAIESFGKTK